MAPEGEPAPGPRTGGPALAGPRERVTQRLAAQARRFPLLDLRPIDTEGLDERDAALAVAIEGAVARRWASLATLVDGCLDRRRWSQLHPRVQAPLLAGAAQLLLLERLPEHAVVNEAVAWTASFANRRAAGLVNAVLHRVSDLRETVVPRHDPARRDELPLADGRAWRLRRAVFAEDPVLRLAQVTAHPELLVRGWIGAFGDRVAGEIACHSIVHPPVILAGLTGADARVHPHAQAGFAVYGGTRGGLADLLRDHPEARVQDPGAAAAVASITERAPRTVVDACAGRGTKTRQLALALPRAEIVASDADAERLAALRDACAAHANVRVVEPHQLIDLAGWAELVVLDVPCSNTAVLARRPEAKYRFGPRSLGALVDRQRQITADSIRLLRTRGAILYTTCSLEAAENEEQSRWLERWHPLRVVRSALRLPSGGPGEGAETYSDGSFHAVLESR